jgi:hypothetical protein
MLTDQRVYVLSFSVRYSSDYYMRLCPTAKIHNENKKVFRQNPTPVRFYQKAFRFVHTMQQTPLSNILADAETILFNGAQNVRHCLHSLHPTEKKMQIVLRKAHHFTLLPLCRYKMFENSFINSSLFANCY